MQTKTTVKAGGRFTNHATTVRTAVRAGGKSINRVAAPRA